MSHHSTAVARRELERACREKDDVDVRLRMLLILKMKYDGEGQNQATRKLHAQNSWVVTWVRR